MNAIDRGARECLAWLGSASWQLAVLVVVIAALAWLLRTAPPRLRQGLWLLVLVKVFLPPSLTAPWSLGDWVIAPLAQRASGLEAVLNLAGGGALSTLGTQVEAAPAAAARGISVPIVIALVWLGGCCVLWLVVGGHYLRVRRLVDNSPTIDEGPTRIAYERLALEIGLHRVPELHVTDQLTSPFLCGVVAPRIVLPASLLREAPEGELRAVLLHELMHAKHGDIYLGWLQVAAQGLFWFHPLVWWANRQLRHHRELVCDHAVLRHGQISAHGYGEAIVRVLTASRGQSLVTGSLIGVLERGVNLYDRLENIMEYDPRTSRLGWGSRLALAGAALVLLPMAPGVRGAPAGGATPQIVSTMPANGAKNVDPQLREISVTFDRDMSTGMSWTGGPPEFPPLDDSRKPGWRDKRTCYLPVKLAAGSLYRVGINSTSHQNFRSASGTPAATAVLYFTTVGASAEVQSQAQVPEVVRFEPNNGAMDVDPQTDALKVTFNMPMSAGMSWTGGGPTFPKIPEGRKPSWSADGLTCTLPVALEPGHEYTLGLNSPSHKNFQSKAGVPLAPATYKFRTSGGN